jgi:hypothetical protein
MLNLSIIIFVFIDQDQRLYNTVVHIYLGKAVFAKGTTTIIKVFKGLQEGCHDHHQRKQPGLAHGLLAKCGMIP